MGLSSTLLFAIGLVLGTTSLLGRGTTDPESPVIGCDFIAPTGDYEFLQVYEKSEGLSDLIIIEPPSRQPKSVVGARLISVRYPDISFHRTESYFEVSGTLATSAGAFPLHLELERKEGVQVVQVSGLTLSCVVSPAEV